MKRQKSLGLLLIGSALLISATWGRVQEPEIFDGITLPHCGTNVRKGYPDDYPCFDTKVEKLMIPLNSVNDPDPAANRWMWECLESYLKKGAYICFSKDRTKVQWMEIMQPKSK
jgi:hypothetical protein